MVGEILLVELIFTDTVERKLRPVVVLKEYKEDILIIPLTTNLKRKGILITNNDLKEGFLMKDSVAVTNKIFFLNKDIVIKKIGKLREEKIKEIKKEVCKELECYLLM